MLSALHRLISLIVAVVVTAVSLAPAAAQDVRELSVNERSRYAAALADAGALLKERRFDAAVAKLDALIQERPREAQARFLRGVADAEQGNTAAAIRRFRELIADYPELPEPSNNLAVILAQNGDFEGARVALENALRAAPDWSVARENLGDVHARLAAVQYERAARGDHGSKTAAAKLARVDELLAAPKPASP